MKVRYKTKIYDAIQYDGYNYEDIKNFLGKGILTIEGKKIEIDDRLVNPGEWIVGKMGGIEILSEREFNKKYEEVIK